MVQKEEYRSLSGQQKASIMMLSLSEEQASQLFTLMDDDEIKELSQSMAQLGSVDSGVVDRLFSEFVEEISATGSLTGTYDSTERLLMKAIPKIASRISWTRSAAGWTHHVGQAG